MRGAAARLALAAISVAAAIWLLPASVHVASWPAAGPLRIGYFAPLSRLWTALAVVAAAALAAAVAWRRSGRPIGELARAASPLALLLAWAIPYLPWLPDRAPLLLVLAGPLRWAVAAAALWGVAASAVPDRLSARVRTFFFDRRIVFAVCFAIYALLGVRFATQAGFGGDEPHYLIITQSLLADGDLDIANNHAQRDYRAFFAGDLRPDFLQRGVHGEIYSIHAPGLPALLLPAYAAGGAIGAVLFVALLGALTAVAVFDLGVLVAGPGPALTACAAVCLTIPFVPHAWLIYPEIGGALIVAWGALWLSKPPVSIARTALHGLAFALLPWLHTKFAVFLAFLTLFETIRLWPRAKHVAALAAPIAVSGALWLLSFYWMYGVVDPEAPYGAYTRMFVLARNIPRGTLGLLFDQKFGLLVYSPVYLVAAAGAWRMLREPRQRARAAGFLLTAAVFFVSTTRLYMWWGGSSAPARFLVPIAPLLAPMIAVGTAGLTGRLGRAWVAATLLASVGIALVTIGSPREELLYSPPHGVSALVDAVQGSAPLSAMLPTFTEEDWRAPAALLWPWLLALGVAPLLTALVAERTRFARTSFGAAVLGASVFLATAAATAGAPPAAGRNAASLRGQLALMARYDPTRLHAADLSRWARLSDDRLLETATITVRRPAGADAGNPRAVEGPFQLPEGRYEARLWFEGERAPHDGSAHVGVAETVELARAAAPLQNPTTLPFVLSVAAPVAVAVSDASLAKAVRRIDIAPRALTPESRRAAPMTGVIDAVESPSGRAYMEYADEHTYPEGGVFWTRGTDRGRVLIATAGASTLRLVLHAGPGGGAVAVEADGRRYDVEMTPGETRDVVVPIPEGALRVDLTVRASRSFVPAEVEKSSGDTRRLGCQVRPVLS